MGLQTKFGKGPSIDINASMSSANKNSIGYRASASKQQP